MAFERPKLFYNNALRDAQNGNDGTSYATCSAAVADPDDPNKVRGDIRPATDVTSLASLEGSGIVFDATKNEYRITDSDELMQRLSNLLLNSETSPTAVLIDGSFIIVACSGDPGVITKYSITDFSFVKQLTLNTGEIGPTAIVKYGVDYFVACIDASNTGILVKVNSETFTRTSALVLTPTSEVYPTALLVYGTDIFVACRNASNTATLVRTSGGVTRTSALVLTPTSEVYPTALVLYGTDIFVACRNASNTATLVRTASGLTRTSALVLTPASEVYPTAIIVYGTDIFVACRNASNTATLVRTSGGVTRTSALVLTPTSEVFPTALVVYGTDIFVSCQDGSGTATLVRTAGGLTRTSALVLTPTSEVYPTALAVYGTDIFVVCRDTSTRATLVRCASGTSRTSAQELQGGELSPSAVVVYNDDIFVLCRNVAYTATLVRVNSETFIRTSALVLTPTSEISPSALVVYGTDIFVACQDGSGTATLVRTAGGLTRTSALVLTPTSEVYPTALAIYGTDIFVACINASNTATLVRTAAGITRTSALVLTPTSETNPTALAVYGTDIFVACINASNTATLVRTSGGLTRTSALVLTPASEVFPTAISVYGTDLFVACRNASNTATLVRCASGTSRTSALVLTPTSEQFPTALAVLGTDIFVACVDASNTATLVRCASGISRTSSLVLIAGAEVDPLAMVVFKAKILMTARSATYFVGSLVNINPFPSFSLFQRLQDADIGTAFSVRAGITCAQADPSRPVDYAADGHLSPRFLGLSNTTLYLRGHMPNFLEDGGFESGAYSPNWTAGANWTITTANKLEGAYSASWDTAANNNLVQSRTNKLVQGRTYRVCVKTKAITGNAAAGCLTITPKQAGSGTTLYAAITGNAIAPTTTATWTEFDIVPDFTTDNWEMHIVPLLANKGSATAIIVDEIYLYEKKTMNTLLIDKHNLSGRGPIVVKAWRLSPLRSTAASDANNYTQIASFTPDTADAILQVLTSNIYPIVEITIPAVASWTAEIGDVYIGDYWQLPRYASDSIDPYQTNADRLKQVPVSMKSLVASYRKTNVEELFDRFRKNEAVWWQWDADKVIMMEGPGGALAAPYSPYRVNTDFTLTERL